MPQPLKRLLKRSLWLLLLLPLSYLHWLPRDYVDRVVYDLFHPDTYVATKKQLDGILKEWPKIKGSQLPAPYLKDTHLNEPSFGSIKKIPPIISSVKKMSIAELLVRCELGT